MVVADEVVVVVKVVVLVVVTVEVTVEVEVVDLMTPTNHSLVKKNGMSLLVNRRGCSLT
jgi:hypothetical protein